MATGLALLACAAGALAVKPAPADTGPQLPDLEQVLPYSVFGYAQQRGNRRHLFIAFGSASQNVGRGRLSVVGRRDPRGTMTADQVIETSDALSPQTVPKVGVLRYTRSPDHEHWHFLDFMRYELHRASDFRRVGRDRKTGFCLGDRYPVGAFKASFGRPAGALPGAEPGFDRDCGQFRPGLRQLVEGISPGKGDDYHPQLEGQSIDITWLRSGRYILVHRTNATRRIRESSYANNVASALLYISFDPRGRLPPIVTVLKTCRRIARCR